MTRQRVVADLRVSGAALTHSRARLRRAVGGCGSSATWGQWDEGSGADDDFDAL